MYMCMRTSYELRKLNSIVHITRSSRDYKYTKLSHCNESMRDYFYLPCM